MVEEAGATLRLAAFLPRRYLKRLSSRSTPMFVAMNRFKVFKPEADAFETIWRERDRHLNEVPGFVEFHLLKGPSDEETVLYASHTIWRSRGDFEAWTKSEAFRKAHASAGSNKPMYSGHPQFEGFEAVLAEKRTGG